MGCHLCKLFFLIMKVNVLSFQQLKRKPSIMNVPKKKKLHSVNVKSRNGGAYILQLAFHPKAILIQSKHRREVNAHA